MPKETKPNLTKTRPPSRLMRPENISVPQTAVRIDRLEARIAKLEKEFAQQFDDGLNGSGVPDEIWPARNKRGPKEKLSLEDLLWRRDHFIHKLEEVWPELRLVLKTAKTEAALKKALGTFIGPYKTTDWARQLQDQADLVLEFIYSKDYRDNPRNLANAIAGTPELSLHRSFKRCRDNPTKLRIGERAVRDYLRRKHPHVFPRLSRARTEDAIAKIMERTNTNDAVYLNLKSNPRLVLELLEEGRPRGLTHPS